MTVRRQCTRKAPAKTDAAGAKLANRTIRRLRPTAQRVSIKMASRDSPASIYETQLVAAIFEPLARILIERARPELGEHVLDAACGTGIVARLVAPMVGPSGRTVGLDYDPIMIEMAKSLAPEIEWRQGDLQNLPFPDAF